MRSLTTLERAPDGQLVGRIIPRSDIPVWSVLSADTFFGARDHACPAITDLPEAAYVTAGRVALALALELLGIRPGEKVLVPAFHCPAMVEPLQWVKAVPVFYRLREDLSADLEDAASKVGPTTRVFMATHYFGFAQDLGAIRQFCDARRIALVEDCAHSLYGSWRDRPLGSVGDFAIGSLIKFLPVRDGGCIVSARTSLQESARRLRRQTFLANIVALMDPVEEAISFGRLPALAAPARAVKVLKRAVKSVSNDLEEGQKVSENPATLRAGTAGHFDTSWIDVRAAYFSTVIAKLAARGPIVARRRRNYARLAGAFAGVRGCRVPMPDLPGDTVPYMFPLWVENLDRAFPVFEDRQVPMQRFGQFPMPEFDLSICGVSAAFRRHAIQLPCHQSLTDAELDEIVRRVGSVLEQTRSVVS